MNLEKQQKPFYSGEKVPVIPIEETTQEYQQAQKQFEQFKSDMPNWEISKLKRFITFCEKNADKYPGFKDNFQDLAIMASEKILEGNDKDVESVMIYASDKIKDLRAEKKPNQTEIDKYQKLLKQAKDTEEESKLAA